MLHDTYSDPIINPFDQNPPGEALIGQIQSTYELAEYAAFMATIIKSESDYEKLKKLLEELKLWDVELQELDREVDQIKLQTREDL